MIQEKLNKGKRIQDPYIRGFFMDIFSYFKKYIGIIDLFKKIFIKKENYFCCRNKPLRIFEGMENVK
jgi:hypothetical protein